MARKKTFENVYVSGPEIQKSPRTLAAHRPTNVVAPYYIEFEGHPRLRGVIAQKVGVKDDQLHWLPQTQHPKWCQAPLGQVKFVRVSVNLNVAMDFDTEF